MKYIVTVNGNKYEVEVEAENSAAPITAAPAPAPEKPAAPTPEKIAAPVPAPAANGDTINAPIPGIILQVKKNSGDTVKKGDILFVLEAMKMENEIFSPRDGVMGEIYTAVGANVESGTPLAALN